MRRTRFTKVFLGCLCLMMVSLVVSSDSRAFEFQCYSTDNFVHIYSDHPVELNRCQEIAGRVLKAYKFVTDQLGWKDLNLLYAQPLQFRLLGGSLKVLGYAQGPNLMVMKDDYLDKPLSEGTLAHELTHIQDLRQLRGVKLPSFLLEGRALTIGNMYRMSLGQKPSEYDRQMASSAVRFTSGQAMELLDDYAGRGWDNQAIGTLLVEYMRTKWRGSGVADIHPRLSLMIERMSNGVELETAFQQEFHESALDFADGFASFLSATQGYPRQRLKGTMWKTVNLSNSSNTSGTENFAEIINFVEILLQ